MHGCYHNTQAPGGDGERRQGAPRATRPGRKRRCRNNSQPWNVPASCQPGGGKPGRSNKRRTATAQLQRDGCQGPGERQRRGERCVARVDAGDVSGAAARRDRDCGVGGDRSRAAGIGGSVATVETVGLTLVIGAFFLYLIHRAARLSRVFIPSELAKTRLTLQRLRRSPRHATLSL